MLSRSMFELGRVARSLSVFHSSTSGFVRQLSDAAPKQSLDEYMAGLVSDAISKHLAQAEKADDYEEEFEELLRTDGLPPASDFTAVQKFHAKRAQIIEDVGLSSEWKLLPAEVQKIVDTLKGAEAEKAENAKTGRRDSWYHSLSASQIDACVQSPQLFLELQRLHDLEEEYKEGASALAEEDDLDPVDYNDLFATADLDEDHAISAEQVPAVVQKAEELVDKMIATHPSWQDPFNTPEFKRATKKFAGQLGITDEELASWQSEMTPEKWRQEAEANGIALAPRAGS